MANQLPLADRGSLESSPGTLADGIYRYSFVVPDEAVDVLGHVNNVEYVRWLQDAAVRHSEHIGLTWQVYEQLGTAFVVRKHVIEYLRPVTAGEQIHVATWIESVSRITAERLTEFRNRDDQLVLRAETTWVYFSMLKKRPASISADICTRFEPHSPRRLDLV